MEDVKKCNLVVNLLKFTSNKKILSGVVVLFVAKLFPYIASGLSSFRSPQAQAQFVHAHAQFVCMTKIFFFLLGQVLNE